MAKGYHTNFRFHEYIHRFMEIIATDVQLYVGWFGRELAA